MVLVEQKQLVFSYKIRSTYLRRVMTVMMSKWLFTARYLFRYDFPTPAASESIYFSKDNNCGERLAWVSTIRRESTREEIAGDYSSR